jgi:2-iminobutanoate/2-iminopropanoate deaminase
MEDTHMHKPVTTHQAPAPGGPYSPAIAWEQLVFVSGQGPVDPRNGRVPAGSFEAEVRQTLSNVQAILRAAGSDRDKVLKVQAYLTDLGNFAEFNRVYEEFFEGCIKPARTTVQVAALPGGIRVEIDAMGYTA